MTQTTQSEIVAALRELGAITPEDSADDVRALAAAIGLKGFEQGEEFQAEIVASLREMGVIAPEKSAADAAADVNALGRKLRLKGFEDDGGA